MKERIVVIAGPTASGKSELAYRLARKFDAEIVNADSVQVYKHLYIGAAKPEKEWQRQVPHHLFDIVDLDQEFTVHDYMNLARKKIGEIISRGKQVFVVGGTGLYIRVLLHGLFPQPRVDRELREKLLQRERMDPGSLYRELKEIDPETASRLHPSDIVRVSRALEVWFLTGEKMSDLQRRHSFSDSPYEYLGIFLNPERERLREAIAERTRKMLERGIVEEVRSILEQGYSRELKPLKSVGYKEVIAYLSGEIADLEELEKRIFKSTWELARRQRMWFKKERGFTFVEPDIVSVEKMIGEFYR